jgi:hypothetical protein
MFKVGDRVRLQSISVGSILSNGDYVLSEVYSNGDFSIQNCPACSVRCRHSTVYYSLELINQPMNIKESFVLALTSEPKKSFRKAGVTNGDDLLTDEGQKIFLTWLLHSKYADEFKTSAVDGLLANEVKK